MIVIGLGHKARQGKNFVAEYMKAQDQRIQLYAFADELKRYCKEHHDQLLPRWQLANQTKQVPACKEDPIYGYTKILQWYGTDVARKQDPDTWVKALAKRIASDNPEIAVLTDVRFPNEAAYVRQNAGYLVQVRRLNADGSQFLDAGRDPNHPSEVSLDNYEGYDYIIEAKDGDLKGLKAKSIGVWNLVKDPEKYIEYIEDYHMLTPGVPGMVDISERPFTNDPYVNFATLSDVDSDSTGFKF